MFQAFNPGPHLHNHRLPDTFKSHHLPSIQIEEVEAFPEKDFWLFHKSDPC
jgi:hypothetical protein